jgi:RNA polymerase sigma factor (sigma-70 family)
MQPTKQAGSFSEEFIPTRYSLLGRLKSWEDQRSWQDFLDTYWRLIYRVARKAGLDESAAQHAMQETVLAVAKVMPRFEYDPERCSFKGWLMPLTRCHIADQFRKRGGQVPSAAAQTEERARTPLLERVEDPGGKPDQTRKRRWLWCATWPTAGTRGRGGCASYRFTVAARGPATSDVGARHSEAGPTKEKPESLAEEFRLTIGRNDNSSAPQRRRDQGVTTVR